MGNLERVNFGDVTQESLDKTQGGGNWKVKPDGWYRVMVTEAPVKDNAAGTGSVVHAKLTHLDPQYQGQYEMDFFNVVHPKEKVQEIGIAQLKSLAIAANHPEPDAMSDTSDLLNRPCMVRLWSKHEGGEYADADGMVQHIGGYLSVDEWMTKEADAPSAANNGGGSPASNLDPPLPSDPDIPF